MSFIGINLLTHIDAILCQDFPESAYVPFGGRLIILVGYFGQIPTVMDKHVYAYEFHVKENMELILNYCNS